MQIRMVFGVNCAYAACLADTAALPFHCTIFSLLSSLFSSKLTNIQDGSHGRNLDKATRHCTVGTRTTTDLTTFVLPSAPMPEGEQINAPGLMTPLNSPCVPCCSWTLIVLVPPLTWHTGRRRRRLLRGMADNVSQ